MNSSLSHRSNGSAARLFIVVLVLLGASQQLLAQKTSIYNLYQENRIVYNPANTGDKGFPSFFYSLNHQWVGVVGAPKVNVLGIHSPITKNMGIGGYVKTDRAGLEGSMVGMLSYSYKVNLNTENALTFGLSAGLQRNEINREDMKADNIAAVSQLAADNYDNVSLGAGLGMRYTYKGFEFGFSMPQLFSVDYEMVNHYVAIASYDIKLLNDELVLQPLVLYRSIPEITQMDFSLKAMWKNSVWFSTGYRTNESSMIIASGVRYYNLDIGYGYQFGTGGVVGFSEGTYSILVAYNFRPKPSVEPTN